MELGIGLGGGSRMDAARGISTRISSHGIREEELAVFAEKVILKGDLVITPTRLTKDIITELYRSTM